MKQGNQDEEETKQQGWFVHSTEASANGVFLFSSNLLWTSILPSRNVVCQLNEQRKKGAALLEDATTG